YALSTGRSATQGGGTCPSVEPYRPVVAASSANSDPVSTTLAALDAAAQPSPESLRDAGRALLSALRTAAPGRSVAVRVPPSGAIQWVARPRPTRGTPPNVVETDPPAFVRLATGRVGWSAAVARGAVRACAIRAALTPSLPCWPPR